MHFMLCGAANVKMWMCVVVCKCCGEGCGEVCGIGAFIWDYLGYVLCVTMGVWDCVSGL